MSLRHVPLLLLLAATAGVAAPAEDPPTDMALKGDRDGTVFRSLTVEADNRVQIRFDRPALAIGVDPDRAPGLMLEDALDILDRTRPDLLGPLTKAVGTTPSRYGPRPWLGSYTRGPVARFTSDLEGVETWKLLVVDSRGETVMVFAGTDDPPREIAWDGVALDGTPAAPGYTYSFVMEASDAAGNRRRFVSEGFGLPSWRHDGPAGPAFLVAGSSWHAARREAAVPSDLLLEAAATFNTACPPRQAIHVVATHRSANEADSLARLVASELGPLLGGAADRLVMRTVVETAAPEAGTLRLVAAP